MTRLDDLRGELAGGAQLTTPELLAFFVVRGYGACQALGIRVEGVASRQCPLAVEVGQLLALPTTVRFHCEQYRTGTCPLAAEVETAALSVSEGG